MKEKKDFNEMNEYPKRAFDLIVSSGDSPVNGTYTSSDSLCHNGVKSTYG
jgi:hypothetical protein